MHEPFWLKGPLVGDDGVCSHARVLHGLGLHNLMLTVFSHNPRGIRAFTRAGFREIGRRREAKRVAGRAYDVVYMDCLATEFTGSVLRGLLPE